MPSPSNRPALHALGVLVLALSVAACTTTTNDATGGPDDEGPSPGGGGSQDGGSSTPGEPDGPGGPSCTNGTKDGTETDTDCGGTCPARCGALLGCAVPEDCVAGLTCVSGVCASPAATDGVKNGTETDVDCGGELAPPCLPGKGCLAPDDCSEKVCAGGVCQEAAPDDGVKNGKETDTDCGGGAPASPCVDGKTCADGARDCTSLVCQGGSCQAPSPTDGVKNGSETDTDCGGGAAPRCADGKGCAGGVRDCTSFVCEGGTCQVPTGGDGVKNGDESDIDCGGSTTGAARCAPTRPCNAHTDCASKGCTYEKLCAWGRSCTRRLGGDTCGTREVGQAGASHESCCMTAPLTGNTAGRSARIDKYFVTAGRMRAFIEQVEGNVLAEVSDRPGWNAAWNPYVPVTTADANKMLGAQWFNAPNDDDVATSAWSKRSCNPGSFGGHTYWVPSGSGGNLSSFTQDQLDPKALNCVGWHLAKAFCMWEGGRIAKRVDIADAFTNGGQHEYPWNHYSTTTWVDSEGVQDARLNHRFNYGFPGNAPMNGGTVRDVAWFVSPPGRFPGKNAQGVDIAGNLLHYTDDVEYAFTWTISWERHGKSIAGNSNWKSAWPGEPNGYYALGFRCAYD